MALFKRSDLEKQGLTSEQIEFIMAESSRSLAKNYTLTSDVETQIAEAVKNAAPADPVDVTHDPAFLAMASENAKLKAFQSDDFQTVKSAYRDIVWNQLDHGDKAKPITEQLENMAATMPELFAAQEQPASKPTFGAPTQGGAPTGETGKSFMDTWGFIPKK